MPRTSFLFSPIFLHTPFAFRHLVVGLASVAIDCLSVESAHALFFRFELCKYRPELSAAAAPCMKHDERRMELGTASLAPME